MTPDNDTLPTSTRIRTYPILDGSRTAEGKFLHIVCEGTPCLLFALPTAYRYHNQLLARFLADEGIAHRWVTEQLLEFDERRVKVQGGGRFRLDPSARSLELWDNSQAYGRFDEKRVKLSLELGEKSWSDLQVNIR